MYWKNIGLLPKLSLIFIGIILLPMILTITFTSHMIERKLEAAKQQQGLHIANTVSNMLKELEAKGMRCLFFMQNNKQLAKNLDRAVLTKDNRQLSDQLTSIHQLLDVDILQVTSSAGRVLFNAPESLPFDNETLSGASSVPVEQNISLISREHSLNILKCMGPIILDNKIIGTITVGFFLDKAWLNQAAKIFKAKLGLIIENKLAVHSFGEWFSINILDPQIMKRIRETGQIEIARQSKDSLSVMRQQWLSNYMLVYIPIKNNQGRLLATMVAGIDKSDVNEAINHSNTLLSMITFIFIFIGIFISYYLSRSLVKPIDDLVIGSRRVSQGDFNYKIETKRGDEVGILAHTFNQMTLDLKKHIEEKESYLKELESSNLILQQQQKKIEEYSHTLEQKVKERTKELNAANQELLQKNQQLHSTMQELKTTQEQMLESQKLAVVGEMAGRVAHEVLNPISAMLTSIQHKLELVPQALEATQLIKEILADWEKHFKDGKLEGYLSQSSKQNEQKSYGEEDFESLNALINQSIDQIKGDEQEWQFLYHHILRVVKIVDSLRGMTRRQKTIEELDIKQPIKEALELMHESLRKRHIELVEKYSPGLPKIKADFNALLQVLCNLIRNSMQAIEAKNPDGNKIKGKITVETQANNGKLIIKVSDTGTGIAEEHIEKIFDTSFTTKGRKEGTGLGLNICRRFIREHGGDIQVEEHAVGKGTTMLIWLPIEQNQNPPESDIGVTP
jgi:two-component system phosphate regulon sensor histidine kinase PhoR